MHHQLSPLVHHRAQSLLTTNYRDTPFLITNGDDDTSAKQTHVKK